MRELLARIEQLPASPETERMLREIRARVVDVDTGETPQAMRPAEPVPPPARAAAPPVVSAPKAAAPTRADHDRGRPEGPPPAKSVQPAAGLSAAEDREWLALMTTNEVLSLDDAAQLSRPGEPRRAGDRRPWTRGLRG